MRKIIYIIKKYYKLKQLKNRRAAFLAKNFYTLVYDKLNSNEQLELDWKKYNIDISKGCLGQQIDNDLYDFYKRELIYKYFKV